MHETAFNCTNGFNVTLGHNLFCIIKTVYTREKTQEKKTAV